MDFEAVGLERAPLREGLLAEVALVGPHARVRPRVPLQVEGVIEPFPAEGAEVPLDVGVALHVSVEQPLQREALGAHSAHELGGVVLADEHLLVLLLLALPRVCLRGQRVLDPVPAVDEL